MRWGNSEFCSLPASAASISENDLDAVSSLTVLSVHLSRHRFLQDNTELA